MISARPVDFDDYVVRNRRALKRFATVLSGQTWLADDLVADVLGRAFEQWDRIGATDDPHAEIEPTGSVSDGVQEHAERDAMIARLAALPRKQRAAVVLRYYAGMSDADIAAQLSCREVTVRSQISRALATLRLTPAVDAPALAQESR